MESVKTDRSREGTRARRWVVSAMLLALLPSSTQAAQMVAVAWDSFDSPLYSFDQSGGEITLLGFSGYRGLNSLAKDSQETLYSVATDWDYSSLLVTIDPKTGAAQPIVELTEDAIRGLAFAPDGTLYGALGSGLIVSINMQTGVCQPVLQAPFHLLTDLAASPEGVLYAWDTDVGLIRIDVGAHTAVDVNPQIGGSLSIQALAFEPEGTLLGMRNALFHIDLNTGATTQFDSLGSPDLRGAQVLAPEPGTILLVFGAFAAALFQLPGRRAARFHPVYRH